ncbi:hypothetical protein GHK46_22520 [Sinorhizobium medicae]|uniref:hypothetical protein n=1 Tax=Sinorhizobium medicae TaxID=110321 RepID=UPI001295F5A8|nr:hypothetical protein [Sinorhizobium medicae]MQW00002.1 hypothetical protein [Sinorhizobium medicae]
MAKSKLIDGIIQNRNNSANLKIVFVDVVAYSQRRSQAQAQVVEAFMRILEQARADTAKEYLTYSEANSVNFRDDVIFIPSGDGAAICFPFDGLHDVHLVFAKKLLAANFRHNAESNCHKFQQHGWCNCHASFYLAIGISDGKGIIYKDVNDNYNVAGNAMNLAARVMGHAEGRQILFTEEAYRNIIDLVGDPNLDENFRLFSDVTIKRGKIDVYQYVEGDLDYLDTEPPKEIALSLRAANALNAMSKFGFPMPPTDAGPATAEKILQIMEGIGAAFSELDAGGAKLIDEKKL